MLKCAVEVLNIIIIIITCVIWSWIVHLYALYGSMSLLSLQGYNSPHNLFAALIIIVILVLIIIIVITIIIISITIII